MRGLVVGQQRQGGVVLTKSAWKGVQSLLDSYFKVRDDDYVIVVYASKTLEHASWVSAALRMRGIPVKKVWMIPLRDPEFTRRFGAALPKPSAIRGRLIVLTFERDSLSHDSQIRAELSEFDADRRMVFRVISTCDELFTVALQESPDELSAKNATILELLVPSKALRVTTPGGSDLSITVDTRKHRWISNRGVWRPGSFVILPAGEVATFPASIEGKFVADFAFNVNMMTDRDARLDSHPVTVWIENNRAVKYECANSDVMSFLNECFYSYCAYTVGEVGFGTNGSIQTPISLNSHINERHPGVHLGFGQSNQAPSVVGYDCNIHLDLIAKGGMVWIDGGEVPLDLSKVSKSSKPHPTHTWDEDAGSSQGITDLDVDDCCGIITSEGLRLFEPTAREDGMNRQDANPPI
jgi:hypothetical protein